MSDDSTRPQIDNTATPNGFEQSLLKQFRKLDGIEKAFIAELLFSLVMTRNREQARLAGREVQP